MSKHELEPQLDPDDRDWFAALNLRRIAGLIAGISLGVIVLSLVVGIDLDKIWPFYSILFIGMVGAFFVFAWADHYARRQIEGRVGQCVFYTAVQVLYVLSVFLASKLLLGF